ncbi:NAD(P)-dependent dehydrogenase (short-subunit alcohol dehydrogenase family) [Georgenia soli]|uniref:NAD(P)-dependent dehydrogenase (Short-subunit alcohol dehydrogenase family) n=1 Tax=Georgenia soli TaxID=638953 RepID=A0A2A9EPX1_9MICO|nr:SDR family oxidoreductase [Georgenia soli]PFG41014.1 NAD(P)-dependent dehydrogenase (short-subunit alcohol dehydrogenase family) [Georgenia soli]
MSTYVVTGAASGIGLVTTEILTGRGHRVLGVDLAGSDIDADLSTAAGRASMVEDVRERTDGRIDAIIACAGLSSPTVATVRVNYYGAIATLEGLRPLLAGSPAPRAVAVASMASLFPPDEELLSLLLDGTEDDAVARAAELAADERAGQIYGTSKRGLALWVRRQAATPEWAGAGIPLNAVAPGIIETPMVTDLIATDEAKAALLQTVPMPLNGIAKPEVVGNLIAWLTGEENTHLCGQVVFVDGGSDAVLRGASTW